MLLRPGLLAIVFLCALLQGTTDARGHGGSYRGTSTGRSYHVRSSYGGSYHVRSSYARPYYFRSSYGGSYHARSSYARPYHMRSSYGGSYHVRSPYARPFHVRSSYASRYNGYAYPRGSRSHSRRSLVQKHLFWRETGYPHGRPGYVVDHIIPLACGGADVPSNMQWQTIAAGKAKDKWETKGCKR